MKALEMIYRKQINNWIVVILITISIVYAQNRNRNWVFSDSIGLKFNQDGTITQFTSNLCGLQRHSCAVLSDKNANMLYYAGGSGIYTLPGLNPNNLRIFRSDNGLITNYPGVTKNDQIFTLQALLDFESNAYNNCLVHMEYDSDSNRHMLLCLSEIDRLADGGMGAFTGKKRIVVNNPTDTLVQGMYPIRHANGRDWWVITHQWGNDSFVIAKVSHDLKYEVQYQRIGNIHSIEGHVYGGGNLPVFHFLKGTSQLVVHNAQGLFEIYDFDRCTGELSNHKLILQPFSIFNPVGESLVFSSTSVSEQYLYIAAFNYVDTMANLLQYDLFSNDIPSTRKVVYSTHGDRGGSFSHLGLAPDGKIYVNCWGDTTDTANVSEPNKYFLAVIEKPDLPFPACSFIPRGLWLNGRLAWSGIPDFIDYDLGPVDGSLCDTLGIDASTNRDPKPIELGVFPNPSKGLIQVGLLEQAFVLYNLQGKQIDILFSDSNGEIILPDKIPDGIYLLQTVSDNLANPIRYSKIQLMRNQ